MFIGLDDAFVFNGDAFEIFPYGFAGDGLAVGVEFVGFDEFGHNSGHTAGAVKGFAEVFACRLAVDEQGYVVTMGLPVFCRQFMSNVSGYGGDVNRRVGRTAERRVNYNGVLEGFWREDFVGGEIFFDHIDDAQSRVIGHLLAGAIGSGDGRASGKR